MSAIPSISVLLAFSVACLVLIATPGPDMSLFISRTLTGGRRAGMAAMLGASAGSCVHSIVAALGLSALIAASTAAFTALKFVGAAYLLWLAIAAIRTGSALSVARGERAPVRLGRTFLVGFGVNLTNPKVVLFFVTFLPQFVDPTDPAAAGQLLVLGLWLVLLSLPASALLVLAAEQIVTMLARWPRIGRTVDYLFAGVFALFAVRIAALPSR